MTDDPERPANAGDQQGRDEAGRFAEGASGNPSGRTTGSRNKASLALDALLEGQAEAIGQRAVELALAGDPVALRLCMERIAPVRRGRPVRFEMPEIRAAGDVVAGIGAVLRAAADAQLAPEEAAIIAGILETKRRALETTDLEQRLAALEQRTAKGDER